MDAFYASIEQRDDPALRGKPVAVGGSQERGVVAAASYEARSYGVRSAMSSLKAKKLCPSLIFVPARIEVYKKVSEEIFDIFHHYTDIIEPLSIDEAYLDVTDNKPGMTLAADVALSIKKEIREKVGLIASAGVSYNKFLAKIASDYRKPDGLCIIHPDRAIAFIDKLPIASFWGVGKATAHKMHALGIHNGKELREASLAFLTRNFGKYGEVYYHFARGDDDRPVEVERIRKSLGCEYTFEKDLTTHTAMIIELYHIATELTRRLKHMEFRGRTLTLKIKFSDFTHKTRSISAGEELVSLKQILPLAKNLLKELELKNPRVRLLGLSVSNPVGESPDRPIQLKIPFKW